MHEDTYWQAVLTRDTRSDGAFVYAVHSTGIYCRPSCPSRKPQREQVTFFAQPDEAQQAGFRACRRCQPDTFSPENELTQRVCRYIETHLEEALTLAALGTAVHSSPAHLQRMFQRVMGISPRQYTEACRMGHFKSQLKGGAPITDALYDAGFRSSSRLYERTDAQLGMTPTTYRKGGAGMNIAYTIVDSPLGRLLIAATNKGVCAVSFGDDDAPLETTLLHEYPAATITRDSVDIREWVNAILRYLNGQQPSLDLPIDVQTTAFRWRVWKNLQTIPRGSTRSYSEIARELGQPQAARAVAQACATNPVALVVPCHRVVHANGDPTGYRWGQERKQKLLEQEANTP
jgi:AraC family transcriptional regulator, regulatory protein of adaptative response / methylated-DNA-[protein]-cysteine methyltransferase